MPTIDCLLHFMIQLCDFLKGFQFFFLTLREQFMPFIIPDILLHRFNDFLHLNLNLEIVFHIVINHLQQIYQCLCVLIGTINCKHFLIDVLDDLILKIIDAPSKKLRVIEEARV